MCVHLSVCVYMFYLRTCIYMYICICGYIFIYLSLSLSICFSVVLDPQKEQPFASWLRLLQILGSAMGAAEEGAANRPSGGGPQRPHEHRLSG